MSDSEDSEYIYSSSSDDQNSNNYTEENDDRVRPCGSSDDNDNSETKSSATTTTTPTTPAAAAAAPCTPTTVPPAWQVVAEMTGLAANVAANLLQIAGGDVERACSLHFENPDQTGNPFCQHNNSIDTNTGASELSPWHLVAEMTGLSLNAARTLLESTGGDLETAVLLHFEGAEAVSGGPGNRVVGKKTRLRQLADEQLRAVAGTSYDAFGAYTAPAKKPTRRQQKQQQQSGGFAQLQTGSDSEESNESSGASSDETDDHEESQETTADGEEKSRGGTTAPMVHPPPIPVLGKNGVTYFIIQHSKKTFRSLGQAENFINSKKYKEVLAKCGGSGCGGSHLHVRKYGGNSDVTSGAHASSDAHGSVISGSNDDDNDDDDDEDEDNDDYDDEDEWVTDEDDFEPWLPNFNQSLFDSHISISFESNAMYMKERFGFSVPMLDRLSDPHALFAYLQEKISRCYLCIFCNHMFNSVHACRQHMIDTAHCKFDFDHDVSSREFYDMKNDAAAVTTEVNGHLVLKNGTRLAHRDLKRYYKQHIRPEDTRLSVVANRRQQNILRQRMRGSSRRMQQKMESGTARAAQHGVLTRSMLRFKGTSKAIASTYVYKAGAADNKHARAVVHHAGSHFHRAGTKQFHRGVRVKGIKARGRHGSKLSSAMVRQRVKVGKFSSQSLKQGHSSSNHGNRRFDTRRA